MQSIKQDERLDLGVVSLMLIMHERLTMVLSPPEAVATQPVTLALLQAKLLTACSVGI